MASPAQPPPSPPPPRRRKRSRSPSGERELGAQFDPQVSPPGRAISSGNNGTPEVKYGSSAFCKDDSVDAQGAKSLSHRDIPLLPGGIGFNSDSNMKLMFGNEHAAQLFGDQAISSGNNGSRDVKYGSFAFSKDDSVEAQGAKSLLHGDIPLLPDQSISLGHKVSLGLNLNSNLKLTILNSKGNEQAPQLFGGRAISSGNNGSPEAKYGSSAFYKDDSVDAQGAKSLSHRDIPLLPGGIGFNSDSNMKLMFSNEHAAQLFGDQSIYLGHKGSLGLNSASNMKLTCLNSKGNEQAPQLFGDLDKSKYLFEMTGCEAYTYDDLYSATSGFNDENLMHQFGPFVYQGLLSSVGKVLVKVYNKVHEKIKEYKGAIRRFSPLRAHKNLIRLIGSFSDEKILILVYRFPFEVSLKDQLKVAGFETENGGLGTYSRYRIALELAEALDHIVKQDIPLIPKVFTEDHVFIGPKGNPVLVDFIGAEQGLGQAFDSTLQIVRHYGILLGKLRTDFKCANGAVLPILDEVWEKLESACIQSNEFKRPSPEEIVYVMKGRTKELFALSSPMHDEFKRKYNLQW